MIQLSHLTFLTLLEKPWLVGGLVAKLCMTCDPMNCSGQASLSMGFPKQDYWSGLLFPSQGIFLTQELNLHLLSLLLFRQILYH